MMKIRLTIFLTLCALAVGLFMILKHEAEVRAAADFNRELEELKNAAPEPGGERVPVLVELFTSEGCSSCPPADALLMQLDQAQPIAGAEVIALSEHVDYWNYLGWADPYSSSVFSRRQEAYSDAFGGDKVYTPQMVVDGQREFVGSRVSEAKETIAKTAKTAKARVSLTAMQPSAEGVSIKVDIDNLANLSSSNKANLLLAITENNLSSNVSRGENSGRKLQHTAVTRWLNGIATIEASKAFSTTYTLKLDKSWKRDNLKVVAFVQERSSYRILGAAAIKLS
jgi:hypothetical protein